MKKLAVAILATALIAVPLAGVTATPASAAFCDGADPFGTFLCLGMLGGGLFGQNQKQQASPPVIVVQPSTPAPAAAPAENKPTIIVVTPQGTVQPQ
jgi:hypothetical protein